MPSTPGRVYVRPPVTSRLSDFPRPFWLLALGTLVNRVGLLVLPFLSLFLTGERGLSIEQATLVVGLHGAGAFAAGALGGALADRVGRKAVLVASLAGGAVLIASVPLATRFASIAGLVAAYGLVGEMYRPAVSAVVADTVDPARQKRAFALLYWAINVGSAVGPALGGLLAERHFGLLFSVDAATMAVYAGIIALGISETRPAHVPDAPRAPRALGGVLKDRRLVGLTAASFAVGTAFMQAFTTLPLVMRAQGLSAAAFGATIGLNGVVLILVSLPVARWMETRASSRTLAAAVATIALGLGVNAVAETPAVYALGVVLWSLGEVAFLPIVPAIVAGLAPADLRGTYQGVHQSGWGAAHMAGPILGGLVLARGGATALWLSGAALCLAAAAGILALRLGDDRGAAL